MNMDIRRALPEEADTSTEIAIAAKSYWGYPEAWIQKWKLMLTFTSQKIEETDVFVRMVDDELAGFYRLFFRGSRAILEDLWIKPDFIGKGVGRALFEHALGHCRLVRVEILEVEADPHAQGFYEKMGMHKVGDRPSDVDGQRNLPVLELKL
jgi:GNAT superfamily N-acetyltransferase